MQKLPELSDLDLSTSAKSEIENIEGVLKKLLVNIEALKSIQNDNVHLRNILLQNQHLLREDFEKKIQKIANDLRSKQELAQLSHKSILKEYEENKLELKKKLILEVRRNELLVKRYKTVAIKYMKTDEEKRKLDRINRKILQRLIYLEKKSLANEDVLKARTEIIKEAFEKKTMEIAKQNLDKEIGYKARINSLLKDLSKYYNELNITKHNYYKREKELKERLKQLLS